MKRHRPLPAHARRCAGRSRTTTRRSAASCSPRATTPRAYLGFKLRMADGGASPVEFTDRVEAELRDEAPAGARRVRARRPRGPVPRRPARASSTPTRSRSRTCASRSIRSTAPARPTSPRRCARFGVEVTEIHGERNPGFGGLHPEPIPPHIDEVARARARRRASTPPSSPTATPTASAPSTATATS